MKLDNEILYTIEIKVSVIPNCQQLIKTDVVAKSRLDAFAIAKEVVTYMYQYKEDCIIAENLIEEKPIYRIK